MAPSFTSLLIVAAVLASRVLAQTTVLTNLTVPVYNANISIFASAVTADATATQLVLACPDPKSCFFPPENTLRYGPKTAEHNFTSTMSEEQPARTLTNLVACDIDKATQTCRATLLEVIGTSTTSRVQTTTWSTDMPTMSLIHAITVTAGLEKLGATPTPTPAGGSTTEGSSPPAQTTVKTGVAPAMTRGVVTAAMMAVVAGGLMFA